MMRDFAIVFGLVVSVSVIIVALWERWHCDKD
jgi:hypothetical protein